MSYPDQTGIPRPVLVAGCRGLAEYRGLRRYDDDEAIWHFGESVTAVLMRALPALVALAVKSRGVVFAVEA